MGFEYDNFLDSLHYAVYYLPITAKLAFAALVIGIIIGLIVAIIRYYRIPVLSQLLSVLITVYQGIPTMVALLLYNLLFSFLIGGVVEGLGLNVEVRDVSNIVVGYIALSLFAITSISETFRGAILSIDKIQFEAGYSIGLTKLQTLYRIIIPQIIPTAIPGLINNMVGIIKGTSLVSAIGIMEVMNASIIPCSRTYSFVEGYVAAALVYWAFTLVLETIAKGIEKKTKGFRKQLG
ncbi:MAG: ABC transporter permease subunit [Lachnospiraceae bacterium]|nr:ABC transporter permease subunit [Lachnospiraceae bacterium]